MSQQTNAQVAALQLEKVRDKIPVLYERGDELMQMIGIRGDVEIVSSRNMRLPLQVNPGGDAGTFNPDGGDMGDGSAESYDFAQVTPVYKKMGFAYTFLSNYATDSREKAIANAMNRRVAEGMKQFRSYLDKVMQTNGNGVLGTISAINGTTLTMVVPYGAQLVYNNQPIQFYDATLTINRTVTSGVKTRVLAADPVTAQTIAVDQVPAGLIVGDVIVSDGLIGANPVDLFGIKYHQSNATTGTWLNLNRASYPVQLATPRVNGNNGALVPMQPRLAINKVRKALGLDKVGKLIAYTAVEQEHAWEQLAVTVQIIDRGNEGSAKDEVDMLFPGKKTMAGYPIKAGQNADQTRIDFLDLSHWGRAVIKNIGFTEGANGKTYFQKYGASGGIAAAILFYYEYDFQIWNDSPRSGSFIDSLSRPAGY